MLEPDIIVTDRGDYADRFIVVEVKSTKRALASVEEELRRYMVRSNYSLGMLVAPGEIRLYRNQFRTYDADSVELLGAYPIKQFDRFAASEPPSRDQMALLEAAVQDWIESLPLENTLDELDDPLRTILADEFVPYIRSGEVRAAHHRQFPTRAAEPRRGG